jgi:lysylphosphatidylglycerol synthetase-like protein (DUF2156 family)
MAVAVRARERVVVHVDSTAARWVGVLAVAATFCWLGSLTALAAVALIVRGIFLGRPVTATHAAAALTLLVTGLAAHVLVLREVGDLAVVASAAVLMWPTRARPDPADLPRVWALVDRTSGDPLAPFAMQALKCHHFTADGTAAIAYRTRLGYAVVSGDPIGDETRFGELVADFAALCRAHGWRIAVLGCSAHRLALWSDAGLPGHAVRAVPIGRDVLIDVPSFDLVGRRFRNLRQAVQRTHNAGITTEIVDECDLDQRLRGELAELLAASPRGAHTERGFSMILDGTLQGRYPGVRLAVARDRTGRVQAFHRYATAGGGADVSLDVPWRRRGAPNGIDERLTVDMISAARARGAQRLTLAFAAFPEIFDEAHRSRMQALCYAAIHLGDALIALESLYRYLRKFHALGDRRYVLLSMTQLLPLLVVLLSLEFLPRRRISSIGG